MSKKGWLAVALGVTAISVAGVSLATRLIETEPTVYSTQSQDLEPGQYLLIIEKPTTVPTHLRVVPIKRAVLDRYHGGACGGQVVLQVLDDGTGRLRCLRCGQQWETREGKPLP